MKHQKFAIASLDASSEASSHHDHLDEHVKDRRYWVARVAELIVLAFLTIAALSIMGCKDAGKAAGGSGSNSGAPSTTGNSSSNPPSDSASAPPNTAPKQ